MEMLDPIHEGHQGIEKCLLHSRESLFWPGISNEIHQPVTNVESVKLHPQHRGNFPVFQVKFHHMPGTP